MTLETILERAKTAQKHDWRTYGYFKNQIALLGLTPKEYEQAIDKLCNVLDI